MYVCSDWLLPGCWPAGMALLEQIGYQLADTDITTVGLLMVMRDPATRASTLTYKKGFFGDVMVRGV